MSWLVLAGLLVLATGPQIACGAPPPSAQETVQAYFHTLARDPLRNLDLLSPRFHRSHGLRPMTQAETERLLEDAEPLETPAEPRDRPARVGSSDEISLDSARMAWLVVQMKPEYRRIASRLEPKWVHTKEAGDRAQVVVRVRGTRGPHFLQRFSLSRATPAAEWRIDRIVQQGVVAENLRSAVVAYPNIEHQRRLRPDAG